MVIKSINPATLEVVGEVEETPVSKIPEIFNAARIAQRAWRDLDVSARAKIVIKVNNYLATKMDDISLVITRETGKPPLEAFSSEVYGAMDSTFYYYSIAEDTLGKDEEIPLGFYGSLDKSSFLTYKPLGVIGVIGPYNYPFAIPFGQITQALIAGNAIVFKPSSETVLVGKEIQAVFDSVQDIPKNLVQTVFGAGSVIGNAIVDHADKIVFTGSTETGKGIMRKAADRLVPVCLELGGKAAMVVLPDANLKRAVLAARWGCFTNSGQVCSSVKRLYLHESIADQFIPDLVASTKQLKQGNPVEPNIDVGTMINEGQMQKVLDAIETAKRQGATVLCGGRRKPGLPGYFMEPTILGNCTNDMDCVQKEIFGPVLPIITFKSEREVIDMVNANQYGLTSSVWTENHENGIRLGKQIDTGTIMINEIVYTFALSQTPWGGCKQSGMGRTHGRWGFLEMSEPFHVHVDKYKEPDGWWMPYDASFSELMDNFKEIGKALTVHEKETKEL